MGVCVSRTGKGPTSSGWQSLELARQARTDPLTGLANRRGWNEQLARELAQSAALGPPRLGSTAGHRRLQGVQRLPRPPGRRPATRGSGCRLAGPASRRRCPLPLGAHEFVALLPDCSERTAHEIIPRVTSKTPGSQSCAQGVVAWDGVETSDELVWRADGQLLGRKRAKTRSAL
jgi:hypothetical protein